jgi:feruloyl esterase
MQTHPLLLPGILAATLFGISGATGFAQATNAPKPDFKPEPLFGDVTPVCACETLTNVSLPNTRIESAVIDPADGSCRVTAVVTHPPAGDRVTVWIGLPTKGWNGRFRGTGGGGFLGGSARSLGRPIAAGYSAGATDTGHTGGSGSFALDSAGRLDWQSIQDNAYLGIHEMTVLGKALTQVYYGRPARYSYFEGGSTGGRQGLSEAQRYPEDYDGIVSACPAINWHRFIPSELWPQWVMLSASNFVPKAKLDAATAAAIAACDPMDGRPDGVIDNPNRCDYDPRALVGMQVGDSPFTEADAEVIRLIWDGPRARDGTFLWYGLSRGTDLSALAGTSGSPLTGRPFGISLEFARYYLKQEPKWDWTTLTHAGFEALFQQSVEQYAAVLGTDSVDLSRFRDRGGKVIVYHGLADQLIAAEGSIQYFDRLHHAMGGFKKTSQFARLFLVPGVDHGFGGPGPKPTGVTAAITQWVEDGRAPEQLVAEKRGADGQVTTRTFFPYGSTKRSR